MKLQLFKTLGMLLALSLMLAVSTASVFAAADAYPSKPVRLLIPFSPGGSNDILGRMIATELSDSLGKQVVPENRPGAGGRIASEAGARAAPDGYTLLMVSFSFGTNAALYKLRYDPVKSFVPVANMAKGAYALTVHPGVPANSVKELIALAKQKPGKLLCGASGIGSGQHMVAEIFKKKTGTDFKMVQFKGGGPAIVDLVGGHSDLFFGSLMSVVPHIESGKLRILATTGNMRDPRMPDVPTLSETVPGLVAPMWWGIYAPAGTPAPIIDRLSNELKTILALAEVKNRLLQRGAQSDYIGTTEFGQFVAGEIAKWSRVAKEANIKVE